VLSLIFSTKEKNSKYPLSQSILYILMNRFKAAVECVYEAGDNLKAAFQMEILVISLQ
jgi:hypothetical protein